MATQRTVKVPKNRNCLSNERKHNKALLCTNTQVNAFTLRKLTESFFKRVFTYTHIRIWVYLCIYIYIYVNLKILFRPSNTLPLSATTSNFFTCIFHEFILLFVKFYLLKEDLLKDVLFLHFTASRLFLTYCYSSLEWSFYFLLLPFLQVLFPHFICATSYYVAIFYSPAAVELGDLLQYESSMFSGPLPDNAAAFFFFYCVLCLNLW